MKLPVWSIYFVLGLLSVTNVNAQTWQAVQYTNGTSPLQRHENGFVEVNGKFYLVGGRSFKSVNIFDPVTKIWTNGAPPPIELHHFQAVAYQNKIYVICALTGGYPAEIPVDRIYVYNTENNTWSNGPTIPASRRRGSAGVALYNNKFYIVCGIRDGHRSGWVNWLDQFDPATGIWTQLPDAPQARDHFHVGLINGKIYSAGGRRTSQPNFAANTIANVDVYDIANSTWSTPSQIPTPRGAPAVIVVNNELVVAGGEVDYQGTALSIVEAYNPASNSWSVKPNLNVGRHATQFVYFTGSLYIVAGSTTQGGAGENNTMAFATFAANTPPIVVQPYPNQSVSSTQTSLVVPLNQIFGDDGGVQNLTFTVPSISTPGIVNTSQVSGTQLTLNLTGTTGTATITLRATDASNTFVQTTFQLQVTTSTPAQLVNVIRINAGGPAQTFGSESWVADRNFTGGTVYSTSSAISNTTQDQIYQTERFGNFQYHIPVSSAGTYAVDVHLAEIYFSQAGSRRFNISVENGQFVRNNLDLIQSYGANNQAIILRADNLNVTDGMIDIVFTSVVDNAKVSGIAVSRYNTTPPANTPPVVVQPYPNQSVPSTQASLVVPLNQIFGDDGGVQNLTFTVPSISTPGIVSTTQIAGTQLTLNLTGTTGTATITLRATDASSTFVQTTFQLQVTPAAPAQLVNVIRINAGGPAQTFGSESWVADQNFTGGSIYSTSSAISNTTQDQIYQTERFGNFQYHIPVSIAGTYAVDLHLAEIYFSQGGLRKFNINIENGQFVRNNLDLIQSYGANNQAIVLRADNLNVTDGMIDIVFTNVVNNAKLSGISIMRYSRSSSIARNSVSNPTQDDTQLLTGYTHEPNIALFPNPVKNQLSVKFDVKQQSMWTFALVDFTGKHTYLGSFILSQGEQVLDFDLSSFNLSMGLYYLSIVNNEARNNMKVIVK